MALEYGGKRLNFIRILTGSESRRDDGAALEYGGKRLNFIRILTGSESRRDDGLVAPGDRTPLGVRKPGVRTVKSKSPVEGRRALWLGNARHPLRGSVTRGYEAVVPPGLTLVAEGVQKIMLKHWEGETRCSG